MDGQGSDVTTYYEYFTRTGKRERDLEEHFRPSYSYSQEAADGMAFSSTVCQLPSLDLLMQVNQRTSDLPAGFQEVLDGKIPLFLHSQLSHGPLKARRIREANSRAVLSLPAMPAKLRACILVHIHQRGTSTSSGKWSSTSGNCVCASHRSR